MKTIITWFVDNSVAANLLMAVLVVGGLLGIYTVHKEEFPNMDPEVVRVSVPYLGAAPEESEQGVCIRLEEAVNSIVGIDKIGSYAGEGSCSMVLMLDLSSDTTVTLNEIKSRVDGISGLPAETERPMVSKMTMTGGVADIAISGAADAKTLKTLAYEVRQELAAIEGISQVQVKYVRPYEISIEVSEQTLRKYGITLTQISEAIKRTSIDMPGGSIRTAGGEILLRTKGQAYLGRDFEDMVILTRGDGSNVTLGEIATVRDGFEDGELFARFDGKPAVMVKVLRVGKEDINDMAADIHAYVAKKQLQLPTGIQMTVWSDQSQSLTSRLTALMSNALGGLFLVMVILTLFLRFRIAMWVSAGIPIAMLGVIMIFPFADISISSMTVMAFILVLGILVDDAIVVGERIYAHELESESARHAAIEGTYEVAVPVIFGVLTTVAAFLPLILAEGRMSAFFSPVGITVCIALFMSLIESQMILPSHLRHRKTTGYLFEHTRFVAAWIRFQTRISDSLVSFANNQYKPLLDLALTWRVVTWAIGTAVLILAIGLIASGRIMFQFFPSLSGDRIYATLTMPEGISVEDTIKATETIENAAYQLRAELDDAHELGEVSLVTHIMTSVGTQLDRNDGPPRSSGSGQSNRAEVGIELMPISDRPNSVDVDAVSARWRELVGPIPDAVELRFSAQTFSVGDAISINIKGRNMDQLRAAATELRAEIGRFDGIKDVSDSFRTGKQEIQLSLLPEARNLGLTLSDLGRQVRQAFYGEQVQRIQRGEDDVRIMLRLPEDERHSIGNLEDMRIRTPEGTEVPFTSVARFELGRGYSMIQREDGARIVSVRADVDRGVTTPEAVLSSVSAKILPGILGKYPTVSVAYGGEQSERTKSLDSLLNSFVMALIVIYALLAIPLRSYLQPLVIMSVIPFGAVGAILGHYIMGQALVFPSLLGMVALSGVVVNSSLVLVDYINKQRLKGVDVFEAVSTAGVVRFRPIILTSVTTYVGLVPLMLSSNPDTAFFVPMAISLAYGVVAATAITLFLVPALYLILEGTTAWKGVEAVQDIRADQAT